MGLDKAEAKAQWDLRESSKRGSIGWELGNLG